MAKIPVEQDHSGSSMILCIPFDINNIYAFFCARYGSMTYNDLMNMGYEEFIAKINSIPKSEPLFDILKSRSIDLSKIKDKEEKKYWQDLKEVNRIPDIYKTNQEIKKEIINITRHNGGIRNGNKFK